ncbi:MAG: NAD(P)/FAD-dependent oxidoreductase [Acidimicrobiia bacterium]
MTSNHAVVLGASLAGLAAARVLSDHVDHVTVLDRDDLPDGPVPRKGVPQGRHAHGLLAAGGEVIGELFPGLDEQLVADGAQLLRAVADTRWYQFGGYRTRETTAELPAPFFSRPLLEHAVRRRVTALRNVEIRTGVRVERLSGTDRVDGVVLAGGDNLSADLVVDCTGRSSQVDTWMRDLGYAAPETSNVHIDMGYASRFLHRSPTDPVVGEWVVCVSSPPDVMRGGVMFPVDGDRWIVTLFGFHGHHPPTDDAGFLAFAEGLPTDDIASVLRQAAPATDAVPHRMASDQRRHFERLKRVPAGYVALGDVIASFNPVYGQGMSSALLQARALGSALGRVADVRSPSLPADFYKRAKKIVDMPWQIAAGGDFMMPETSGPKPPGTDLVNRYLAKAFVAAQHDPVVNDAVVRVQNLLAPPPSLMRPALMRRVLRGARRGSAPTLAPRPPAAEVATA